MRLKNWTKTVDETKHKRWEHDDSPQVVEMTPARDGWQVEVKVDGGTPTIIDTTFVSRKKAALTLARSVPKENPNGVSPLATDLLSQYS